MGTRDTDQAIQTTIHSDKPARTTAKATTAAALPRDTREEPAPAVQANITGATRSSGN